ncbi:MAG: alanine racemase [Aerococcus sp.]|nr:alanine racemase [Aerococcus sp.]
MLTGKHRSTRCIISNSALQHNYLTIKNRLPHHAKVWAVVKADGYGHGAIPVAKALDAIGADGFCVAISDEALELRQAEITAPILILGITHPGYAWLHATENISVTVSSVAWLEAALANRPASDTFPPLHVHLKVDTGMGRIGVRSLAEGQAIVDFIAEHPEAFILEGIFTHYATADGDSAREVALSDKQSERFDHFEATIDLSKLPNQPLFHRSNSALAVWQPDKTLDFARLGIALYGVNPSNGTMALPDDLDLQPVLTWETKMDFVKQMHEGETISYGATYTASEGEWIATLPIGYADGFNRALTGFELIANGKRCPIVGRVCMDQCLIRLPEAMPVGTRVTIIGTNRGVTNTAEDISNYLNTIAHEVFCGISTRVQRVYH